MHSPAAGNGRQELDDNTFLSDGTAEGPYFCPSPNSRAKRDSHTSLKDATPSSNGNVPLTSASASESPPGQSSSLFRPDRMSLVAKFEKGRGKRGRPPLAKVIGNRRDSCGKEGVSPKRDRSGGVVVSASVSASAPFPSPSPGPSPRRPGRPKGSKNKPTAVAMAAATVMVAGRVNGEETGKDKEKGTDHVEKAKGKRSKELTPSNRAKCLSMPIVCGDSNDDDFLLGGNDIEEPPTAESPQSSRSSSPAGLNALSSSSCSSATISTTTAAKTSTSFVSMPKLAYSSATNKPVCLCIIWVHLQASMTSLEGVHKTKQSQPQPGNFQKHQCVVKRAPQPVSKGHKINCHYCGAAYASYALYLDHLHSTDCGQRQRRNNKPQLGTNSVVISQMDLSDRGKGGQHCAKKDQSALTKTTNAGLLGQGKVSLPVNSTSADKTIGSISVASLSPSLQLLSSITGSQNRQIANSTNSVTSTANNSRPLSVLSDSSSTSSVASTGRKKRAPPSSQAGNDWGNQFNSPLMHSDNQVLAGNSQHHLQQAAMVAAGITTRPYLQHHIHSQQQPYHPPSYQQQMGPAPHMAQFQQQFPPHHRMRQQQQQFWQHQHQRLYSSHPAPTHQHPYLPYPNNPYMMYGGPVPPHPPQGGQFHQPHVPSGAWPAGPGWGHIAPQHPQQYGLPPETPHMTPGFYNGSQWDHSSYMVPAAPWAQQAPFHQQQPNHQQWRSLNQSQRNNRSSMNNASAAQFANQHQHQHQLPHQHQHQHQHQQQYQQLVHPNDATNHNQNASGNGGNRGHYQSQNVNSYERKRVSQTVASGNGSHGSHLSSCQYATNQGESYAQQQPQRSHVQYEQQPQQQQQHPSQEGKSATMEMPPRPSSDDDVIRAAAEVVARENGTLPILPVRFQEEEEDASSPPTSASPSTATTLEIFDAETNSTASILLSSADFGVEREGEEVVCLDGLANITSLNSLVSLVTQKGLGEEEEVVGEGAIDIEKHQEQQRQQEEQQQHQQFFEELSAAVAEEEVAGGDLVLVPSEDGLLIATTTDASLPLLPSPVSSSTDTAHSDELNDDRAGNRESQALISSYSSTDDKGESFLKESSHDPVLTATAQLGRIAEVSSVTTSSMAIETSQQQQQHQSMEVNKLLDEVFSVSKNNNSCSSSSSFLFAI